MIVNGLVGETPELSCDKNGNHVIQRCLEIEPVELRYPVFDQIISNCIKVGMIVRCEGSCARTVSGAPWLRKHLS